MNIIEKLAVKFARFQIRHAQKGGLFPVIAFAIAAYNTTRVVMQPDELQMFNFILAILCFLVAIASFYDLGIRLLIDREELFLSNKE